MNKQKRTALVKHQCLEASKPFLKSNFSVMFALVQSFKGRKSTFDHSKKHSVLSFKSIWGCKKH